MNYTEQLERETERTRAELANTVEELRERLTPGGVLDEILDYAGSGDVGDYLRNFRRQVVDNPLPLGLMGVSVAWLVAASAFGGRRKGRWRHETTGDRMRATEDLPHDARDTGRSFARRAEALRGRAYDQASDVAGRTAEQASEFAGRAANHAGDFASRTADQAADIAGQASDRMADIAGQANAAAARAGDRMRSAAADAGENLAAAGDSLAASARSSARAVSDTARGIGRSSPNASRALVDFGREQPLIVAATGIVLGALIGALLPSTQIEDELIGESADAAKERLREMAGEQYEKVKDVAMRTAEAALDASGVTGASSHGDDAETHGSHEFGPGPGVHGDAEHASGDHPSAAEEAEHTRAGGA